MRPEKMMQRSNVVVHSQNGRLWNVVLTRSGVTPP
jgi:hypothetical protein